MYGDPEVQRIPTQELSFGILFKKIPWPLMGTSVLCAYLYFWDHLDSLEKLRKHCHCSHQDFFETRTCSLFFILPFLCVVLSFFLHVVFSIVGLSFHFFSLPSLVALILHVSFLLSCGMFFSVLLFRVIAFPFPLFSKFYSFLSALFCCRL